MLWSSKHLFNFYKLNSRHSGHSSHRDAGGGAAGGGGGGGGPRRRPGPVVGGYSKDEIEVLRRTSLINGREYVPFMSVDLKVNLHQRILTFCHSDFMNRNSNRTKCDSFNSKFSNGIFLYAQEKFAFSIPFTDKHGKLELSPKQKVRSTFPIFQPHCLCVASIESNSVLTVD